MRKNIDVVLLSAVIIISIFGAIMIYSSSNIWAEYKFNDAFRYLKMQSIFLIIGIILMIIISKIPYSYYKDKANIILLVCFLLLVLVAIPGIGKVRNGSRSWFGIGSLGIQPSEFMKLALIIFTSKYLEKNEKYMSSVKKGILPILSMTLLVFFLIMLQPDFGTGVIIVMTIIGLLFVSGVKLKFFIIALLFGVLGAIGLIVIAPYRFQRILSFLNPWIDPLGSGFQAIQSLFAIGPSGFLGLGLGNSIQKHFYLPEPQTDFIFAIISEELGFLGILIVSILFITIIYRGIKIALTSRDLFSKYLAFGIIFCLAFQTLLNLMVVVSLIPITGVTLPFLSYGGSSLLITMISMGIILNISKNNS